MMARASTPQVSWNTSAVDDGHDAAQSSWSRWSISPLER